MNISVNGKCYIRAHKTNHKYEQDLKYIIQETIMSLQLCLAYLIEYLMNTKRSKYQPLNSE